MKWWNIFKKVMLVSVVLLLLYLQVSQPNVYMKLWFAVLWSIITIITILRTETIDWPNKTNLRLPQAMQLAFALLLVLAAAVATDWANLGRRDLFQWGYALFALPAYRQGFIWARSHFLHV
jgi:phosphatidylserine synthase